MRYDDDVWDINHGVGVTALYVASGRALEVLRPRPIIYDPYAYALVQYAGHPRLDLSVYNSWPSILKIPFISTSAAVTLRTYIIDGYICAKTAPSDGVKQVVLLAAGLDSRPFRLAISEDVKFFELDREEVLYYKDSVIYAQGAQNTYERISLPVDLRHDWIDSLIQVGYNPDEPTVWVTEGILPYLPHSTQYNIARKIISNSAPGSQWISDFPAPDNDKWYKLSFGPLNDFLGVDMETLFYDPISAPTAADLFGTPKTNFISLLMVRLQTQFNFIPLDTPEEMLAEELKEYFPQRKNTKSEVRQYSIYEKINALQLRGIAGYGVCTLNF